MGADLYIKSIDNKNKEKYDGVFNRAVEKRNKLTQSFEFSLILNNKLVICPDFDEPYVINENVAKQYPKEYVENARRLMDKVNKAQRAVSKAYDNLCGDDGYFRDSYNGTSVLNSLGLSWWQDVIPMLNKNNELTPDKAKDLINMIKTAKLKKITKESLKANHCKVENETDVFEWKKYYNNKKRRLIKFLSSAIELNEPVYCSL